MDSTSIRVIAGGLTLLVMGVLAYLILAPVKPDTSTLWGSRPLPARHPSYLPLVVHPPGDWIKLGAAGRFDLLAPPGTAFRAEDGADAVTGSIDGMGFKLTFDFGLKAADPRDLDALPGHRQERALLNGRPGTIRTAEDRASHAHQVGLYISAAHCHSKIVGFGCNWDAFAVRGTAQTPADVAAVRMMFGTLVFATAHQ